MARGAAIADIEHYSVRLAEHLLETIDPVHGGFGRTPFCIDAAAHQLLWRHYMVTGRLAVGDAVVASLRSVSRSSFVDTPRQQTLGDAAQLLELLSWVWRQLRCPEFRRFAEGAAACAVELMRSRGVGFASRGPAGGSDEWLAPAQHGLTMVALIEAGSVLERRDWLALARDAFDAIVTEGRLGASSGLEDHAMMSRAAIRLFEAFGKPRYLELAEAWVAMPDDGLWDTDDGGYRTRASQSASATFGSPSIADAGLPSANALMIGVLARLHALTGQPRYADRAAAIVEAFRDVIPRSGIAAATAVANALTLARLVSIKVSGDPKLAETRALMRAALDCGLPDRLALGPGAGDPADASPRALVRVGTYCLPPIVDPAKLRLATAPGALFVASGNDAASQIC